MSSNQLKKCPSCGKEKEINQDYKICTSCFRALNYGEINNNLTKFTTKEVFKNIDLVNNKFYLVIDIHNFPFGIIKNLNQFIPSFNLYILVNKIDIIPKSIKKAKIISFIKQFLYQNKIKYKEIILLSAKKNIKLDYLNSLIFQNKNNVFLGNSNVGKSSLINALSKLNRVENFNLVSYTIGTTKDSIKTNLNKNINLIDLPGFYDNSNLMNYLEKEMLKKIIPKNEIRVKNYLIEGKVLFEIENIGYLEFEQQKKGSIQFFISNELKIERKNLLNSTSKLASLNKAIKKTFDSNLIFINGLGFIKHDSNLVKFNFYSINQFQKIK